LAKFSKNAANEYETPKISAKQTKVAQTTIQAFLDSIIDKNLFEAPYVDDHSSLAADGWMLEFSVFSVNALIKSAS